jgi:hypothetical protein
MIHPEVTVANGGTESPEVRRARQAAEDVAAWHAAFRASKVQTDDRPASRTEVGL